MSRVIRCFAVLTCLLFVATVVSAQETDAHLVHAGISPFGIIYGSYKLDVGVPLGGLLEVGGQITHFRGEQFANLVGNEPADTPSWTHAGATVRVFPAQNASGFFIGGRIMYLNVDPGDPLESTLNDAAVGIDLGWRWKWPLAGNIGMFFQTHFGVQRWIFSSGSPGLVGDIRLPIWPTAGVHFGVYL